MKYLKIKNYDFELVKNQRVEDAVNNYYDLWDCYNHFSYLKNQAFNRCKTMAYELEAYNCGINSYNTNMFTYTFMFEFEGKTYKALITSKHNYIVEL